jgi:hypothetical protein
MRRLFVLVAALLVTGIGAAEAVPSDGPSSDTTGTSATVSPRTLPAGSVITFTVRGFPAGQTVSVKIDDGALCADATHGACVYLQQKIPASGTVSGSFTLPRGLGRGAHWLRFLASGPAPNGNGTVGYTCRGDSDFTVIKAGARSSAAPSERATVTVSSPTRAGSPATAADRSGNRSATTTPTPRPSGAEPAYAAGQIVTATPSTTAVPAPAAPSSAAPSSASSAAAKQGAVSRTSGTSIGVTVGVLVALALAAGGAGWALVRRWG